jgi:hypothetical protein
LYCGYASDFRVIPIKSAQSSTSTLQKSVVVKLRHMLCPIRPTKRELQNDALAGRAIVTVPLPCVRAENTSHALLSSEQLTDIAGSLRNPCRDYGDRYCCDKCQWSSGHLFGLCNSFHWARRIQTRGDLSSHALTPCQASRMDRCPSRQWPSTECQ